MRITLCYMMLSVFILSGCSMFDGMLERMQTAEQNLNASQDEMRDARDEFDARQAVVDARQAEIENALAIGDLEMAKALSAQAMIARADAAAANERLKAAEENVDQLGDIANAAKIEYDNSTTTWEYIKGIAILLGGFFGVGSLGYGAVQRQRRKITEQNQLNPNRTG